MTELSFSKLLSQLSSCDRRTRRKVVPQIAASEDPRAVETLLGLLADPELRQLAVDCLVKKGDTVSHLLLPLLEHGNDEVRAAAAEVAGRLRNQGMSEALRRALQFQGSVRVQRAAAEALGKLRDPASTSALVAALDSSYATVRCAAAEALGRIRDPSATEPLCRLLLDNKAEPLQVAATALGKIKDERAVQPLVRTLESLLGPGTSILFTPRLIVEVLVKMGRGDAAVPPLLRVLHEKPLGAAEILGKIGDKRAVEPLIALLQQYLIRLQQRCEITEEQIVYHTVNVLGKIGDPRALKILLANPMHSGFASQASRAVESILKRSAPEASDEDLCTASTIEDAHEFVDEDLGTMKEEDWPPLRRRTRMVTISCSRIREPAKGELVRRGCTART